MKKTLKIIFVLMQAPFVFLFYTVRLVICLPFILLAKVAMKKDWEQNKNWERCAMMCYYVVRFFFKSLTERLMKK